MNGDLKTKLKNHEFTFGTMVWMTDPMTTDIFSNFDYDYLWIDTEHAAIDYEKLLAHVMICGAKGKGSIVRMQIDNYNHTKRVLEMGVSGVIFPMINTKEQAQKAIASTYYPPKGNRGIGGIRFAEYGEKNVTQVYAKNEDLIRCVQIETKQAVDNLEEICTVEGIDCFIFGLCDLSFDIGKPGDVTCEEEMAYVRRAIEILKKHDKAIGLATANTSPEFLKFWADLGVTMFTAGDDFDYLRMGAKETLKNLNVLKEQ